MKHTLWVLLLGCGALLAAPALCISKAEDKKDDKGTPVEMGGLKATTPASWKSEKPSSDLRAYQFKLPAAKDDKDDADLVIFYFGPTSGGTVKENIERWKKQMIPPEGKKVEDVAKVEKSKVGDVPVTTFEMEGTYVSTSPRDPKAKPEMHPDYRFVGVIFESPKGSYYVKLTGPAKTIGEHKKAFDDWVKAFK